MIIIDSALRQREQDGRPVRVGMIGAGFMGRALANQLVNHAPGIRLAAIAARNVRAGVEAFEHARVAPAAAVVDSPRELDDRVASGRSTVVADAELVCAAPAIDLILDVTGAVDFGAKIALAAFEHRKHVVLMNAELDATLGPILQVYAKKAGVVLSACDGDQPGVALNLYRFVKGLGLIPRVLGSIKGLHDRARTPETQRAFAERWGQKPTMVTSFADGSKINFEQTVMANATGMTVACRGMLGGDHTGHVDDLVHRYDLDELKRLGGIVDYVIGASPQPGVFCLAENVDPRQEHLLRLYKLGDGPLYSFYTPYHLCHFEVPNTIGRVALFGDATAQPVGAPCVEVCAVAKRDVRAGESFDSFGGYMTYGEAVSAVEMRAGGYVPEGLIEGCLAIRDVKQHHVLRWNDVEPPGGRWSHRLYAAQISYFTSSSDSSALSPELARGMKSC
jgi:predicted homoserine dehydrogenase-like protein